MTPPKKFRKSNSFVEIRGASRPSEGPARAFQALERAVPAVADAYRRDVLSRARDLIRTGWPGGTAAVFPAHVEAEVARLRDDEFPRYFFYRYRYDVFPARLERDDFPPCLQIEPSSVCNYRCVFCYQTDKSFTDPGGGHMGTMPLDLFKKLIDEAQGRCEAVTLASRGEPLLCRDIDKMLAYAKGKFLALKINTNAWFLDEKKTHALLAAEPSTIVFSADAAAEPLYSQLRVNGQLDRVVRNIALFQKIRQRDYPGSRTITRVSGVSFRNDQSLGDMEKFWGGMVDQVAFVAYNPWENVYESPLSEIETPCSDLWRRMFVWWDGTVNPCDVDYKSVLQTGNARTSTLAALWGGAAYEGYRRTHREKKRAGLSPCRRCTVV